MTDVDNADDQVLLANTPAQAEPLLYNLELVAKGIGLFAKYDKKNMCLNQDVVNYSLNGRPLKLVNQFTHRGSNISSTESDVNISIGKALTTIDKLSTIRKFHFADKIKRGFIQAETVFVLLYGCTHMALMKRLEKKLDWNYKRMQRAVFNKSWKQHLTKYWLYGHLPLILRITQIR